MPSIKRPRIDDSSIFASDVSMPLLQPSNAAASQSDRPMPGEHDQLMIKHLHNPKKKKKIVKLSNAETIDQSRRPSIFTIETTDPAIEPINVRGLQFEPIGDSCYYCKKQFRPLEDIFMYRGLAFCEAECRDFQIHNDKVTSERDAKIKNWLAQKQLAKN